MHALTEQQIRDCFVNATRREVAQATLPDLAALPWDRLDYLGWRDRRAPLSAYVVVEHDDGPVGVLLRAGERSGGKRRRAVCAWCADVVETEDVSLYVARRAGAAGRKGDTIGTLICTDFRCSRNVRRPPTRIEAGSDVDTVRREMVRRRTSELRERSRAFVDEVLATR